jgi:hypothetical protein
MILEMEVVRRTTMTGPGVVLLLEYRRRVRVEAVEERQSDDEIDQQMNI